jgi:hypothetical protein
LIRASKKFTRVQKDSYVVKKIHAYQKKIHLRRRQDWISARLRTRHDVLRLA